MTFRQHVIARPRARAFTLPRARGSGVPPRSVRGFTLVELVVVIVIVGVIAAVAMPRFVDNRVFQARGFYEDLAAGLKLAQKIAVASGCSVRVAIDAAGYEARQQQVNAGRCDPADASWSTPVLLADGELLAASTPSGVVVAPAVTIVFDSEGSTSLGADQAISVDAFALTVHAASGYVDTP